MADTLTAISVKRLAYAIEQEVGYGLMLIERGLGVLREIEPPAKALDGFDSGLLRAKCGEVEQAVKVLRELADAAVKSLQEQRPLITQSVDHGKVEEVRASKATG